MKIGGKISIESVNDACWQLLRVSIDDKLNVRVSNYLWLLLWELTVRNIRFNLTQNFPYVYRQTNT